jgi:hypothetical protein
MMKTPRGTARASRRQKMLRPWPSPGTKKYVSQPHELDDDGCCKHCGFDAVEEYHLRVMSVPPHAREPKPDYATYCDHRPWIEVQT